MERSKTAEQAQFIKDITAGLAHEIRNPIAGIKGALEVFHRELDLSGEDRAVFEEMLFQVRKLDFMVRSFLEYARPPEPRNVPSNINSVIRDSLALLSRYELHRNIRKVSIREDFSDPAPLVNADSRQLQHVFLNLTLNALDTMKEGGTLLYKTAVDKDSVRVEVSDAGLGINRETVDTMPRQFLADQSLRRGANLVVSRLLIERHGGQITVDSGEKGTVFRLNLPLSNAAGQALPIE